MCRCKQIQWVSREGRNERLQIGKWTRAGEKCATLTSMSIKSFFAGAPKRAQHGGQLNYLMLMEPCILDTSILYCVLAILWHTSTAIIETYGAPTKSCIQAAAVRDFSYLRKGSNMEYYAIAIFSSIFINFKRLI